MKKVALMILTVLLLVGCASTTKVERYSDQAEKVCGKGNVAYVDAENGKFGCKK